MRNARNRATLLSEGLQRKMKGQRGEVCYFGLGFFPLFLATSENSIKNVHLMPCDMWEIVIHTGNLKIFFDYIWILGIVLNHFCL